MGLPINKWLVDGKRIKRKASKRRRIDAIHLCAARCQHTLYSHVLKFFILALTLKCIFFQIPSIPKRRFLTKWHQNVCSLFHNNVFEY